MSSRWFESGTELPVMESCHWKRSTTSTCSLDLFHFLIKRVVAGNSSSDVRMHGVPPSFVNSSPSAEISAKDDNKKLQDGVAGETVQNNLESMTG